MISIVSNFKAIAQAQGNAAKILEDGKARAEGTLRLAESWRDAGSNARDIYLCSA